MNFRRYIRATIALAGFVTAAIDTALLPLDLICIANAPADNR